ncbi:MAG: NAD(P)-binding protein [Holosporaceae bacterium]|jgi:UDP-galactopyranose mutase|nr:NAD(P)-binding protein [Holosporaceae bacterium]
MKTALVIGGGFTGFTWSHLLSQRGWIVKLLEKESFIGGGVKTLWYGGHPYTLGPRPVYTKNEWVYNFIDKLAPLRLLNLFASSYVEKDGQFYNFPPHKDDIAKMPDAQKIREEMDILRDNPAPNAPRNFEESWQQGVGNSLYEKLVKDYTSKVWGVPTNTVLNRSVHVPKLKEGTRQWFHDYMIAYPKAVNGWDDYFTHILESADIEVILKASISAYDLEKKSVYINGEKISADLIVSSISLDELCENAYGALPYMGREIMPLVLPVESVLPGEDAYFWYYTGSEPFCRIVEYKKLTGYSSPHTLLGIEFPKTGFKHYPYLIDAEIERAKRYLDSLPDGVISVGRLGKYQYTDMCSIVEDALNRIDDF